VASITLSRSHKRKEEKKIKGKTAQPPFNLRFALLPTPRTSIERARALLPEHNLLD
jgi:hypothetical protein